jgi:hypothetical protein
VRPTCIPDGGAADWPDLTIPRRNGCQTDVCNAAVGVLLPPDGQFQSLMARAAAMTLPSEPTQTAWSVSQQSDNPMSAQNGPSPERQSVAVLECPLPQRPGPARRDRGTSRHAGADTRRRQVLRDGGSPNLGRTAGSKRVIAETWVPDRVRTISPTV